MGSGSAIAIAVPAAIGAAAAFGAAGLLQHQASRKAPRSGPLNPKLLRDLMQMPHFRWSVLLGIGGFGLQVLALRFAPLAVVQPLLVTGVLFYLGFASLSRHEQPDRVLVLGAVMALIGLVGFLLVSRPSAGPVQFSGAAALPLGLSLVALVGACLLITPKLQHEYRVIPFAAATAVCYGVTASLVRSLLTAPSLPAMLGHWELYAVIAIAPAGFLLNQNAFQEGRLGSLALTITTVGDPVVAIGSGAAWLNESLSDSPGSTLGEVLSLMLMAAGVVLLATRAQQMSERIRQEGDPGDRGEIVSW